jgi:hypothetical protein
MVFQNSHGFNQIDVVFYRFFGNQQFAVESKKRVINRSDVGEEPCLNSFLCCVGGEIISVRSFSGTAEFSPEIDFPTALKFNL